MLPVEVEAWVPPGALRTPEGRLLSSLLGSGVGGSLSPGLVSTGARGGVTPPVGRKDPSPSAALPTLAGALAAGGGRPGRRRRTPWPQEEDAQALCGPLRCLVGVELFCLQLLSGSSPDPLTGARRLHWGLAGTRAAGDSAPSLRSQAREALGAQHLLLGPWPSVFCALSCPHVLSKDRLCCRGERGPRVSPSSRRGRSLPGTPSPRSCAFL